MAKQIIILDHLGPGRFRFALWAAVPAGRQVFYAQAGKVSAWTGASLVENQALALGQVAEFVDTTAFTPGTSLAQVQTGLQQQWQDFQAEISAANRWVRYGSFWDGTTWTAGGAT